MRVSARCWSTNGHAHLPPVGHRTARRAVRGRPVRARSARPPPSRPAAGAAARARAPPPPAPRTGDRRRGTRARPGPRASPRPPSPGRAPPSSSSAPSDRRSGRMTYSEKSRYTRPVAGSCQPRPAVRRAMAERLHHPVDASRRADVVLAARRAPAARAARRPRRPVRGGGQATRAPRARAATRITCSAPAASASARPLPAASVASVRRCVSPAYRPPRGNATRRERRRERRQEPGQHRVEEAAPS